MANKFLHRQKSTHERDAEMEAAGTPRPERYVSPPGDFIPLGKLLVDNSTTEGDTDGDADK
jgi:hypothetical protein